MRLIAILLFESLLILANPLEEKEEWMDSNKIRFNPAKQLTGDVNGKEVHIKKSHDQITVLALAVGQGDSTLIICPNNDLVIIDMGSSNSNSPYVLNRTGVYNILVSYHNGNASSKFRIIITHPDKDHYNYFQVALQGLESSVEYFILGGDLSQYTDGNFSNWLTNNFPNKIYSINGGSPCFGNTNCTFVPLGKSPVITPNFCNNNLVKFTILAANLGNSKNSKSTVMKMQYGTISLLFPGDFASNVSQNLLINHYNSTGELSATIYKMAHHGSANQANNFAFFESNKAKSKNFLN